MFAYIYRPFRGKKCLVFPKQFPNEFFNFGSLWGHMKFCQKYNHGTGFQNGGLLVKHLMEER
jgi:hypothetical protein